MNRVLLHIFPSFAVGGAPVRAATLANYFGGKFHHIVVALDGDFTCTERFEKQVSYELLNVELDKRKRSLLTNLRRIRRELTRIKPDLLLTYNWGSIEWGLANYFSIVKHIHAEDGFGAAEAHTQFRRRVVLRRFVLARSHRVVVPSESLRALASRSWMIRPDKLEYIPNGIDCCRFARAPVAEVAGQILRRDETPIIGTIAALRPEKNLTRLIRAFAIAIKEVPARLLIVGDGGERSKLEGLARDLEVSRDVFFSGHVPQPEQVIGAMDVFALSSDTEQMPYSILEAMAAKLPIATVNVGDVGNMLAPINLPYVVGQSDEALAQALVALLKDPQLRAQIGVANQERVRRQFDQQQMFDAYEKLYHI